MATYPVCWASWHSPFDWEFALGLLRAMGERSHRGEYPRAPDERAGTVVVVAAEEGPLMGFLNDCDWLAETPREQAICVWLHCEHTFVSLLLDLPFTASILSCITNWANRSWWSWKLRWHLWCYRRPYQSEVSRIPRQWSTDNWRYRRQNLGSKTGLRPCRGFAEAPQHGDFHICLHATDDISHGISDLHRATESYGRGHGIWNTIHRLRAIHEVMWSFITMIPHIRW